MKGSYQLNSFTENKNSEVKRLQAQVDLFFTKEFEIYEKFGLRNGMKIIECGSGPGFLIRNILSKLPDCQATALEIDPFLIEVLRENSIKDNVKLFDVRHASIYDTHLPDNTYDFVITRLVIEHLQTPASALAELYRILKPGGKLIIISNDFDYHLLTYPVIPELDEMYRAYCESRFSQGGNPLIGRQIPVLMRKEKFSNIQFEIISVHSDLVGDKAMLKAENVNISKSLVSEGFLKKETLDSLAANWYKMLQDPDHVIFRQLFMTCGEKDLNFVKETLVSDKEFLHESYEVATFELPGLNKGQQEDIVKSFLTNQVKKVMGNSELNVKNEEKLCDIDIDSIAAAELSSNIKSKFDKAISISDILQKFSINDITKILIENSENVSNNQNLVNKSAEEQQITQENISEVSQIQQQFWILHKVYPENTAYNIPSALKIEGDINLVALDEAINKLILRHEILKVSFYDKSTRVFQKVLNDSQLHYKTEVTYIDESFNENSFQDQISDQVHKPFDLTTWPLFRIRLFSYTNNVSILTLVFHHIIIDLQSRQVFAKELEELYNSYSSGREGVNMGPVNKYSDFSRWHNDWLLTEDAKKKIDEWKEEIPASLESIQVAPDFSRPKVDSLLGTRRYISLDSDTSLKVEKFANDNSVNAFTVLLSAYSILLNRLSNQSKIVIGVPLTNRRKIEFADTLGCFVNIVPILVDFNENTTGNEILVQIRQSLLKAHRKQEIPFLQINNLLRTKGTNSIFRVGFTFETPMQLSFNNLNINPLYVNRDGSQLDLFLGFWKQGEDFHGYLEYSTTLYKEDTINRIYNTYYRIINAFIEGANYPVSELKIITEEDSNLIKQWNDTDHQYDSSICLHQKFEEQVKKTPFAPAIMYGQKTLSYEAFDKHVNRMANYLVEFGVKVEDKICICMERSPELLVGIYAVHKAGAAYLPVDPNYPRERLEMILEDSNPKVILTNKLSESNIPGGFKKIYLDNILESPLSEKDTPPDTEVNSKNLAYVIYTSGSTGIPKGVMIEHHSVINKLEWMQYKHPLNSEDTIMLKTPVTFDVSVWELFWWMFNGSKLCILSPGGEKDPKLMIEEIESKKITTIVFVPSMFSPFVGYVKANLNVASIKSLKWIIQIGEALSPQLVNSFNELLTPEFNPLMVNTYGPTEATVAVSWYNCPKEKNIEKIYIGKPIFNTKLLVLNNKNMVQPVGVTGELVITGVNLSRGYLNRPELNAARFIQFEYPDKIEVRGYKTGDLVRWTDEGNIDFIGRSDTQVKIRGYRIELGDIESKLLENPKVKTAAVIVNQSNPDNKIIVGYVVLNVSGSSTIEEIRRFLNEKLPDYMIPAHLMILEDLPLNTSGKIDRKALPEPDLISREDFVAPVSTYEKKLLQIWKETLNLENIGITHNFFDIGGNSLTAIHVVNEIKEKLNILLEPIHIMEFPNIKGLARFISNQSGSIESQVSSGLLNTEERKRDFSKLQNKRR